MSSTQTSVSTVEIRKGKVFEREKEKKESTLALHSSTMAMVPEDDEVPVTGGKDTLMMESESSLELVKCECCQLTEECTFDYISTVRKRFHDSWICGLCSEAVQDEIGRAGFLITTEEALDRHKSFCNTFRSSSPPTNPTGSLISAVKHLLRRSLDSPRATRSMPNSPRMESDDDDHVVIPRSSLNRSESCLPTFAS